MDQSVQIDCWSLIVSILLTYRLFRSSWYGKKFGHEIKLFSTLYPKEHHFIEQDNFKKLYLNYLDVI